MIHLDSLPIPLPAPATVEILQTLDRLRVAHALRQLRTVVRETADPTFISRLHALEEYGRSLSRAAARQSPDDTFDEIERRMRTLHGV